MHQPHASNTGYLAALRTAISSCSCVFSVVKLSEESNMRHCSMFCLQMHQHRACMVAHMPNRKAACHALAVLAKQLAGLDHLHRGRQGGHCDVCDVSAVHMQLRTSAASCFSALRVMGSSCLSLPSLANARWQSFTTRRSFLALLLTFAACMAVRRRCATQAQCC